MSYKKSLLSLAIAATFSCAAQAVDFQNIYFFGDSLTDTGAFTGAPGVAAGAHFTVNPEPNYADLLAAHYGVTFVLATATQPALGSRFDPVGNKRLLQGLDEVSEIIAQPGAL